MDDLDDGLVWEKEKRGDGGVQYRQGQSSLRRILETGRQVGKSLFQKILQDLVTNGHMRMKTSWESEMRV